METNIINNVSAMRFEITSGNFVAFLEYEISDNLMSLVHTEVPSELGGGGIGGKLVKFALDFAGDNDLKIVARCEFAKSYILRHKEYSHLL